jgi:FkbM family methyltransferase
MEPIARARDVWGLIRLAPFDTTTDEGRSRERYRRAALTVLAAAAARGTAVLASLLAVPLTVHYLGDERYGLWTTVTSFVLMLSFADLGLGNGLLNALAEAYGRDDREAASRYVSSGFFALAAIGAAVLAMFGAGYAFVPWARLLNATGDAAREAGPTVAAFAVCFALALPLGVVQRVQQGYQQGFASNLWQCAGSVLGLAAIVAAIRARAGLPWLMLATSGAPLGAALANAAYEFGRAKPWLRPRWALVDAEATRKIVRVGVSFFVLQLAAAVTYATDSLVITHAIGPSAVTQYAVPARLFSVFATLSAAVVAPLWPAYGEAAARKDVAWVRRTLGRSLVLVLAISGLPSVALIVAGRDVVRVWVGGAIVPSTALLAGLAAWTVLGGTGNAIAMFLNGVSRVRVQIACAVALMGPALGLKILLVRAFGIAGVPWATFAAYSVFVAIPLALYVSSMVADFEGEERRAGPLGRRLFRTMAWIAGAVRSPDPLVRLVARVARRLLRAPFARWRRSRPIVEATVYGRPLLMRADHGLPFVLSDCPRFGAPLAHLVRAMEKERVAVVDVGANIGDTVALLEEAAPGKCAFLCVEPDEDFARLCAANVHGLADVALERCFVADDEGLALAPAHHGPGTATAVPVARAAAPTRTLDTLAEPFAARHGGVDVVKVDTDGFDAKVLRSAPRLLERYAPALFFELHPALWRAAGEDPRAIFAFLARFGYEHFVFFTNRGEVHARVSAPGAEFLDAAIALSLSRRATDDFHYDVLAAPAALCDRVAAAGLGAGGRPA